MATMSEIHSLETIHYKSKVKFFFWPLIVFFLFTMAFTNFYPLGDKFKVLIKSQLKGTGCNPNYDQIRIEWLMPKIVVTDLELPMACFQRQGEALKFNHMTLNWHLINFSPFGLPFRLDTEFSGQPISLYYVMGIGQQLIRLKDQTISLGRLQSLLGENFKLDGAVTMDLNLLMSKNQIKNLSFKAVSKNLVIPPQNIQGFTLPSLKLNELYAEAESDTPPRIRISRLVLGDVNAPIRANFKGRIEWQQGAPAFSPLDLNGEVAFSESFKQTLPLIDIMFQSFTQKDGFYQIRLGGTLGAPKPSAP